MNARNRRRHVRQRAKSLAAHLHVDDRVIMGSVEDISLGGAFVRTDARVALHTPVVVDLAKSGMKRTLRLRGAIVTDTSSRNGLGIRFDPIDGDLAERLGELLRDLGGLPASSMLADPPPKTSFLVDTPRTTPTLPRAPTPFSGMHVTVHGNHPASPSSSSPAAAQPAAPAVTHVPTPVEERLMAQLRGVMMELGNLQATLAQRDREVLALRAEIERLGNDSAGRSAAEMLIGKLTADKERLEVALVEQRNAWAGEAAAARAAADDATLALARVTDALRKLR